MEKNKRINAHAIRAAFAIGLTVLLSVLLFLLVSCRGNKPGQTTTTGGGTVNPPSVTGDRYISPSGIAFSPDGTSVYVSDATGEAVYRIASDGNIVGSYPAGEAVNNVVTAGDEVYMLVGGLGGRIDVASADLSLKKQIKSVGHTPVDLVVHKNRLYVANRFSCTVTVIDKDSGNRLADIEVGREPMALTLVGDDLYVACHLPEDAADSADVSAYIYVIDTGKNSVSDKIKMVNGAGNVKDITAAPDGKTVYASHIVSRYQYPTTQLDAGWVNTNAISVIDTASKKISFTFLLDDVEHGAPNPWGLAMSDDGSRLYCALAGTDELVCVDISKLNSEYKRVGASGSTLPITKKEDIVNYIPFARNAKKRISLGGKGARAVGFANGSVYVAEYFTGKVKIVDADLLTVSAEIGLGDQPKNDAERLGEIYWNDASICYQNWQSCASCHPDARSGGFNWDELGDGIGTMKQTKSMIYVMRTPPCLATGLEINGEHGVMGSVSGTPLWNKNIDSEAISEAMIAYLRTLAPVPSPYLNDDGSLTESAKHGKELFESYGCAACHPAPLYTDMKLHDSPTLEFDDSWEYRKMDTPTLVEVWRSYPWSYIGHFTDMKEIVKYFVTKSGKKISDTDAADLAEFVLSIGAENEVYGVEQVKNGDGSYNKVSDNPIVSISLIAQQNCNKDAKMTLAFYDEKGNLMSSVEINVGKHKKGERIVFDTDRSGTPSGYSYYTVTVSDADKNLLATELRISK